MNKYNVTQELMNELNKWNETLKENDVHMDEIRLDDLPALVDDWIFTGNYVLEITNRLITLMHFVNGDDVFEIGTPTYIVQRNDIKSRAGRQYLHITSDDCALILYGMENATRFDDFEEASGWANKHFEVVEVDE